jgi:hypothetical protein
LFQRPPFAKRITQDEPIHHKRSLGLLKPRKKMTTVEWMPFVWIIPAALAMVASYSPNIVDFKEKEEMNGVTKSRKGMHVKAKKELPLVCQETWRKQDAQFTQHETREGSVEVSLIH